jgi:flagellar secretion chaperone FliS
VSHPAVARYQQNDVFSMSPARRVVFLYGQTLASLRQAGRFMEKGDIELRGRSLMRASDIVAELLCSLDFESGGEIATNLARLYTWMMTEILEIDRHRDAKRLARLATMVAELHAAWDQAEKQVASLAPAVSGE